MIPFSSKIPQFFFTMKNEAKNGSHKSVPCDMLLLTGSCIVNEAMLTGESTPQVKDSLNQIYRDQKGSFLDISGKNKNNILYCGTEVI